MNAIYLGFIPEIVVSGVGFVAIVTMMIIHLCVKEAPPAEVSQSSVVVISRKMTAPRTLKLFIYLANV